MHFSKSLQGKQISNNYAPCFNRIDFIVIAFLYRTSLFKEMFITFNEALKSNMKKMFSNLRKWGEVMKHFLILV